MIKCNFFFIKNNCPTKNLNFQGAMDFQKACMEKEDLEKGLKGEKMDLFEKFHLNSC